MHAPESAGLEPIVPAPDATLACRNARTRPACSGTDRQDAASRARTHRHAHPSPARANHSRTRKPPHVIIAFAHKDDLVTRASAAFAGGPP